MKRYAKPVTDIPVELVDESQPEFDIEALLSQGGEILRREIRNLMRESSGNKLSAGSARDLVAYLRLLHELRNEQEEVLKGMTDEELEKMVK